MTTPRTAHRLAAAGLALAGLWALAGCHGHPATDPTTPPPASPTPSPTPTPSPSPTGPVRAADDPTWTAEQLAAVRLVDAYTAVLTKICLDPAKANLGDLLVVTADPQYSRDRDAALRFMANNIAWVGDSPWTIPVTRSVSAAETVNGHQEIHVAQCEATGNGRLEQNGNPIDMGAPRDFSDYAVQWVDPLQDWRIVERTTTGGGC